VTKSTLITARIDPELKQETEKVFDELGLSMTQAITLFFKQVKMRQGLPFAVAIPNTQTRQAIDDALTGKNLQSVESVDALFDELGA
jgi:DNA-damage-inducible protein J